MAKTSTGKAAPTAQAAKPKGNWKALISDALAQKKPAGGFPKADERKKKGPSKEHNPTGGSN